MLVANVVVDVSAREIDTHFDYSVPPGSDPVSVGSCVLVDFANRPVVGYVVGISADSPYGELKPLLAVLGGPYFSAKSVCVARWIAQEYLCPLSDAVRLFTPPGGVPRAAKVDGVWVLKRAGVGPVDDRWAFPVPGSGFTPRVGATMQRAVLDALAAGPVRAAELVAQLGSVDGSLRALEKAGAVRIERIRRTRGDGIRERSAPRHERLTAGQVDALAAIGEALGARSGVVLLDGVTGSGKTEVYLRAIEDVLAAGGGACVLVPEISLTPQTVGRFRSRFGDEVAVLHSRLSAGERFDQWELVASGAARIVVGARSALFAPVPDLRLIVIDEEHEPSYKQGSAPRYHARDVAVRLAEEAGAVVVLGSASPAMETRYKCATGVWRRVELPERVTGRPCPQADIVDLSKEFSAGHRGMISRLLLTSLQHVRETSQKAVLFLNRRGFASFLLCRECGHVPSCDSCATSLTFHEVGSRLMCHHCGAVRAVPATCPACGSPYLRQFGAGTQRIENELAIAFPDWPVVRMDADTTKGKGAHERLLAEFESHSTGVLLGTQMIAKGLDYPEVTLVGVITADVTLNLPDFRAGERTYQLLEQVAGRAGRGAVEGRVVIQTYWPDHPAIVAAATHDPDLFYGPEERMRAELGYPPSGRLVNVVVWGEKSDDVARHAARVAESLNASAAGVGWTVLGPSPAPLSRLKGVYRWHILVKTPVDSAPAPVVAEALRSIRTTPGVRLAVDVDPVDLM